MSKKKPTKLERRIRENFDKLFSSKTWILGFFTPYSAYSSQISKALELLLILESSEIYPNKSSVEIKTLRSEARKNFLISCVTALENYIKYWVLHLFLKENFYKKTFLDKKGIIKLIEGIKEKYNLELFAEEIKEEEITKWKNPSYIITRFFSFQNLNDINFVMSKITGRDFFGELESTETEFVGAAGSEAIRKLINEYTKEIDKVNLEKKDFTKQDDWKSQLVDLSTKLLEKQGKFILKKKFPNWKEKMSSLFELRNEFVHYISSKEIGRNEIIDFLVVLDRFVQAVCYFLEWKFLEPIVEDFDFEELEGADFPEQLMEIFTEALRLETKKKD